jgi:hypothetical protein
MEQPQLNAFVHHHAHNGFQRAIMRRMWSDVLEQPLPFDFSG